MVRARKPVITLTVVDPPFTFCTHHKEVNNNALHLLSRRFKLQSNDSIFRHYGHLRNVLCNMGEISVPPNLHQQMTLVIKE